MDMKKIYRAQNNAEADIIKGFLAEQGIEAYIQGYSHRSILGLLGPYVQLNILVAEKDEEEAKKLIDEYAKNYIEVPDTSVGGHLKLRPKSYAVALVLAFVFPGLGNCYAGRLKVGAPIVICLVASFLGLWMFNVTLALPFIVTVLILFIIDASSSLHHIHNLRSHRRD